MIAAAITANPHDYDCARCAAKHCDTDRRLPESIGPAAFDEFVIYSSVQGEPPIYEANTCPLPTVGAGIWSLFRLYRLFEKGVLFTAGGVSDQPNVYLDAMDRIEQALKNG